MEKENKNMGILEERNKIVEEFKKDKNFNKSIFEIFFLVLVVLISAFITYTADKLIGKYIPEQLMNLFVIFVLIFTLILMIVTFFGFVKPKKMSILLAIFYGMSMIKVFDFNINNILPKFILIFISFSLVIMVIKKVKSDNFYLSYFLLTMILIISNFGFQLLNIKSSKDFFIYCLNVVFLNITLNEYKKVDFKESEIHLYSLRCLVFLMGALHTLM